MRKLIKVTKKHIKDGEPEDPFFCPVALALNDSGFVKAGVACNISDCSREGYIAGQFKVTRSVNRFIRRFDNKKPVKPFNFYLTPES